MSPDMYGFLRAIAPTSHATAVRTLGGAALRWLSRKQAPRVRDLFRGYLFELPPALPLPATTHSDAPALAIVGGMLLYGPDEVGTARGKRKLFAELVFCPERAAALLDGTNAPAADPRWSGGAVAPFLRTECAMPAAEAARSSIADMFYFRSHAYAGQHSTGGVIDLFPVELAQRLAHEVIMERKTPFNRWLALPALRAVIGIDGATRLRHVHGERADAWVDTRDVSQELRDHGIGKRIDWTRNRIHLDVPKMHAAYVAQMRVQWEHGYRKGMAAFAGTSA